MSEPTQVDYDSLAAQHGGAPVGVDYDALAAQHGGAAGDSQKKSFSDYANDFKNHFWTALENSAAAPAVAYEMYKHATGQPNQLAEMPGRAAATFFSMGDPAAELQMPNKSPVPQPEAASKGAAVSDLVKREIASKIPFAERLGLVKKPTMADYFEALTKSPEAPAAPVPKPPEVPPSQANPEQFSFTHRQTGPAYAEAGPVRTGTVVPQTPAPAAEVSSTDIKTSPGFQMPERKMPANIPPIKASDFAQPIKDIIDQAVPPENKGMNAVTQSKVEFALKRGDVAQAEAAIDSAAKQVKSNWPPESPVFRGGVNDIREATKFKTPEDLIDDRGIQQEMARDLEVHGLKAESEARREFIARNSTGITKGELTGTLPTAEGAQIRAANQAAANASTSSPGASAGTAGQVPKAFLKKAKWLEDRLNQQK